MVAIAATSYATPSTQAWAGRARLDQARRQAEQAESNARALRGQADQAEQEAQKGQQTVRAIGAQLAQADSTYTTQLRQQRAASESRQVQGLLRPDASVQARTLDTLAPTPTPAPSLPAKPWSDVNQSSGRGRFVNVSA